MQVLLKTGLKAGEVIEVEDPVGQAFLHSGRAEEVTPEKVQVAEVAETPERPKRRTRKTAARGPETR